MKCLQPQQQTSSSTSVPGASYIAPRTFSTAHPVAALTAPGFAGREQGTAALAPCWGTGVALPPASKPSCPQSRRELIPQAGAAPGALEPGPSAEVQLLARVAHWAAGGTHGAIEQDVHQSTRDAGHLFSSSCGIGLPEGIRLRIPAKVWDNPVWKWL